MSSSDSLVQKAFLLIANLTKEEQKQEIIQLFQQHLQLFTSEYSEEYPFSGLPLHFLLEVKTKSDLF